MRIIILNTNSFGGNYEYSRCIAEEYVRHQNVTSCIVLIPENAVQKEDQVYKKVLISDISTFNTALFRKLYFLYRSIINPFKTYKFLKNQPASIVLFNDYEQITSFIWAPLFRRLKNKHTFAVILHDPDRDAYLPIKKLSSWSMHLVMQVMDAAFYHEFLPDKNYYALNIPKYKIPHGLYVHQAFDRTLYNLLLAQKGTSNMMGVIGNIRDEKNYTFLIESLTHLPDTILLIAGNASNSEVPIDTYKSQIEKLNVGHQVIWIEKRLSDDEMQAVIKACDLILLYYKHTFTSQSGILNLIAPHKKKLIVSDSSSALTQIVKEFQIGKIVPLDMNAFVAAAEAFLLTDNIDAEDHNWDEYISYASWKNNVNIVLDQVGILSK